MGGREISRRGFVKLCLASAFIGVSSISFDVIVNEGRPAAAEEEPPD